MHVARLGRIVLFVLTKRRLIMVKDNDGRTRGAAGGRFARGNGSGSVDEHGDPYYERYAFSAPDDTYRQPDRMFSPEQVGRYADTW